MTPKLYHTTDISNLLKKLYLYIQRYDLKVLSVSAFTQYSLFTQGNISVQNKYHCFPFLNVEQNIL